MDTTTEASSIWEVYINSHIVDANSPNIIWAGPNATSLPLPTPIHVVTACNPFKQKLSDKINTQRNKKLLNQLEILDIKIKPVIGCSPNGDWQEPSFAIYGLNRKQACELATKFEQRGIFEITDHELLVIELSNQDIMLKRPRIISTD